MKSTLSFILTVVFLLQTFVTVQAMPVHEGKAEMSCLMKQKVEKKHSCCSIIEQSQKEKESEKKGCCSGTTKMSCCVSVIAITPNVQQFSFLKPVYSKQIYGYIESHSSFEFDIFHPPIFA